MLGTGFAGWWHSRCWCRWLVYIPAATTFILFFSILERVQFSLGSLSCTQTSAGRAVTAVLHGRACFAKTRCPSSRTWVKAAGQRWVDVRSLTWQQGGTRLPPLQDLSEGATGTEALCLSEYGICKEFLFNVVQNQLKLFLVAIRACLQMVGLFEICDSFLGKCVLPQPVLCCQCCWRSWALPFPSVFSMARQRKYGAILLLYSSK